MHHSWLLRSGYDGRYKFGILPVSTFCSGHTFFTQRMHQKLKLQPYVVHATFQFSGTPGKRHRMREFMLWHVSMLSSPQEHIACQQPLTAIHIKSYTCISERTPLSGMLQMACRIRKRTAQYASHSCLLQDPPEYYDRPGGYLVYTADVPAAMVAAAVPATLAAGEKLQLNGTVAHFELVHHQLKQVRLGNVLRHVKFSAPSAEAGAIQDPAPPSPTRDTSC